MTERMMNNDGSVSGYQPGDKIISPAAAEFNADLNRFMKKAGPLKKNDGQSLGWPSQSAIMPDDNGHICQIVEANKKSQGESKYSILYFANSEE